MFLSLSVSLHPQESWVIFAMNRGLRPIPPRWGHCGHGRGGRGCEQQVAAVAVEAAEQAVAALLGQADPINNGGDPAVDGAKDGDDGDDAFEAP